MIRLIQNVLTRQDPTPSPEPAQKIASADCGLSRAQMSSAALAVVQTLQDAGFVAYIVGGAVRDALLGLTPKDFDVVTNAHPEDIRALFRKAFIIGRRFRIVHVYLDNELIEVTTFRALHEAETDESGRVLADNVFGSEREDAQRRDFTINALLYDPFAECIVDYHHGLSDLRAGKLVIIGDAHLRYREDPVRMLRAIRLAAKLNLSIDSATQAPIRQLAPLLNNVPTARLFDETCKILLSGHVERCFAMLQNEGFDLALFPLLQALLPHKDDAPDATNLLQLSPRESQQRFIFSALSQADQRLREQKPVSLGFLLAVLLWQDVRACWLARQKTGVHKNIALQDAIATVQNQNDLYAIPRKHMHTMYEIWLMQPRFEARAGERPYRFLQQSRFRAAYDFLLLRAHAGEVPGDLAQWWEDFQNADATQRQALQAQLPKPEVKTKKRRRRKPKRPLDVS